MMMSRSLFSDHSDAPPSPPAEAAASELSGPHWVARFPTSQRLEDLIEPFRTNVGRFIAALQAAGASVRISATYRPPERAYLMHYAKKLADGRLRAAEVPPMAGVPIEWVHATEAASRQAAAAMVRAYGIVYAPALRSRHTEGRAIDMTIDHAIGKTVETGDGSAVRVASLRVLHRVGASYGVIKLLSDPPHWSDDGH
ncbi:hypothetical protein AAW51_0749 [Caldimonas brevitalea]|uniref:Uncharacterized protein n=2 Tax=Caldimonas brevitalea TaxID=413882 RepID=A0A0G3BLK6_9BURK|nr:hypothetical protein AAW51_0749 [Caldimonas brevitalea]